MLVGISLVSVITATVAAWFLSQTREATEDREADLQARLTRLETTLGQIHAALVGSSGSTVKASHPQPEQATQ